MDGQRFDQVTRLIGSGASRRSVLKGLTGALVGAVGLAASHQGARATITCLPEGDSCGGLDALPCCIGYFCSPGSETCIACLVDGDDSCGSNDQCCSGNCAKGVCFANEIPDCETDADCGESEICCGYDEGGGGCVAQECCGADDTVHCGPLEACTAENTCELTCAGAGEECSPLSGGDRFCCEGFVCNSESVCELEAPAAECEDDGDCDAGEICCAEVCRAIECCIDDVLTGGNPNDRCPTGSTCFEGQCVFACKGDSDCASGTCCCGDGTCSSSCCDGYVPPANTGGVTTLPSTGIGNGDGDGNLAGLLGAGIVAGAAAYLAGKKIAEREGA